MPTYDLNDELFYLVSTDCGFNFIWPLPCFHRNNRIQIIHNKLEGSEKDEKIDGNSMDALSVDSVDIMQ